MLLLGIFSVIWIALGFYLGRKNRTFEDHALAGRNVGLAFGSATAVATWITSNTTMMAPQFALQMGIWGMLAYSTASVGLFLFAPLARRIRELMPQGFTCGDFIRLRYGRHTWILFLCCTLFYSLVWLASMAMAGGILLESISAIPYFWGMTVLLFVCVLYTVRGGLYAVIGTDFVQSVLILGGIVWVGFSVLDRISLSEIHQELRTDSPYLLMIFFPAALIALFNNLFFGIGEIFHNNVWWSRAFAFRAGTGMRAYLLAGLIWLPVPVVAGFIALAAGPLGISIHSPDSVGPLVIVHILGKAGAILAFVVIFSSLASSIDSLLAATADLITEDLLRGGFKQGHPAKDLRRSAQWATVATGILAWLVCLPRPGTLAQLLFLAGPVVGSLIWPVVAGLYWERTTGRAALWGILLGSAGGLLAYSYIGWYSGALAGSALSMIVVLTFSLIQDRSFDWSRLQETKYV